MSQCWPRSLSLHFILRPKGVKIKPLHQPLVDGNDILSDRVSRSLTILFSLCVFSSHPAGFDGCQNGRFGSLGMNELPKEIWKVMACKWFLPKPNMNLFLLGNFIGELIRMDRLWCVIIGDILYIVLVHYMITLSSSIKDVWSGAWIRITSLILW